MKHTGTLMMSGLSILYIAAILLLRGNDVWMLFKAGNLNELGDFLAGFFTPLAFGWLVYGYLLQSKELRLQREELTLTRDQLGKQTELLEEQVTADHQDAIPRLTLRFKQYMGWILENKGGNALNMELLNLSEEQSEEQTVYKTNCLPRNESLTFKMMTMKAAHRYEARFNSERSSERFHQRWKIEKIEGGLKCKEITHGPEPLATEE